MNRKEDKKENEKYIFEEFTRVCPLDIVSFESKNPPEPDILCQLKDGNKLTFELGETVDNKIPHKNDVIEKAEECWEDYKNKRIPKNEKERFDRIFSGCSLTLSLSDQATKHDIEKAIPKIFKRYQNLCRNQLGLIHHDQDRLPKGCEIIRIEPQDAEPIFRCSRASHIATDHVIKALKNKFRKRYKTPYPIQLLIYNNHHSLGPDCILDQYNTKDYIEKNIDNSPFERIWIFNRYEMKIVYVYPEINN